MKKRYITPTQIIILGFLVTILLGSLLLSLPIANQKPISYTDSLFTAVSATCVTGLTTLSIAEQFTTFGQVIILLLIQIGGLGFMVFVALLLIILGKKISLKERILISQSLNQNTLKGMVRLTKIIFKYTLTFELVGALLLAFVFVPMYGWGEGIFQSIFHAVSAFCNAGLDIAPGNNSLAAFVTSPLVNIVLAILTILGGIGFFVWSDLENCWTTGLKEGHKPKKIFSSLSVHTKLVLILTAILILVGTVSFLLLEKGNLLADFTLGNQWLVSFFQSVQTRTSGMSTLPLGELLNPTKILVMVFMLIGGSPGSTAGGVKTVTVAVVLLSILSSIKSKKHSHAFKHEIPEETIERAHVILEIALLVILLSTSIVVFLEPAIPTIDILFECISAYATVGLSTGITATLSLASKAVLMLLMFIGRVGTITMAVLFVVEKPKNEENIRYAQEKVMIG